MFKKKSKEEEKNFTNNPFLDAKKEWLERYSDYIIAKKNWQNIAMICAFSSLVCIFFLGYIGTQNKLVPYVIKVDKLGNTASVGLVKDIDLKNPNVIKYSINTFIYSWRTLWGDEKVQTKFIKDAYNYLLPGSKAYSFISKQYKLNNPFKQGLKVTTRVHIKSIIPQSIDTWVVEWVEITSNLQEVELSNIEYKAYLQIQQVIPSTEEQILKNPLGVFITNINYSKIA